LASICALSGQPDLATKSRAGGVRAAGPHPTDKRRSEVHEIVEICSRDIVYRHDRDIPTFRVGPVSSIAAIAGGKVLMLV